MASHHDVSDFQKQVLEASQSTPTLVDFWAPWCQPCVILTPILEKLEREAKGRWQLRKVNVDQHPAISQQYHVQGIPAVKLFVGGAAVGEFVGVLPESQIKAFLQAHLPPTEAERILERALAAWQADDAPQAKALLTEFQGLSECTPASNLLDARLRLFAEPQKAEQLVKDIREGDKLQLEADAIRHLAALLHYPPSADALPDGPAKPHYLQAIGHLTQQAFGPALEALIEGLIREPNYREGAARKHGVALFGYLGASHPTTQAYRRRFDMSLA